jgi:rhodanese-related sulfurtransferase
LTSFADSRVKVKNFLRILGISLALAAYAAWVSSARDRLGEGEKPSDFLEGTDIPLLNLADTRDLWQKPSTFFLDVRSSIDYEYGHIQGAVNLPLEEFDDGYPALKSRLERAAAIVVYCKSEDCGKSYWAALRLRREGLSQTNIYPYGWNEWTEHQLPITRLRDR